MESIWMQDTEIRPRTCLPGDIRAEVAVIGAGMAGVLTAYFLQQHGFEVVLLDAGRIGSGQTQKTTAKITSQHGLCYARLLQSFGAEKAKEYADANQNAIEEFVRLIEEQAIDCQLERLPAYLYSTKETGRLEEEAAAVRKLGLEAELTTKTTLPFPVRAALRFPNQAQFHPLRFLDRLASGLTVYENTRVTELEEGRVRTDRGTVLARQIVVTAHYPFLNRPGYYFMRMHQERSYVMALRHAATLDGMYYGIEPGELSFRTAGEYLLLSGGAHRTGENSGGGKYASLWEAARRYYPACEEAAHWSAQDCITLDQVPYIGPYSSKFDRVFVATGFGKWGMSTSMAAAKIITGWIAEGNDSYALFHPQRFRLSAAAESLVEETIQSAKGLSQERFVLPKCTADELPNGHGGIVEQDGKKYGVYKDEQGRVFLVQTKCPHLGCQLEWNPDERSWDCPCHGSRFDYQGNLLDGPAQTPLHTK